MKLCVFNICEIPFRRSWIPLISCHQTKSVYTDLYLDSEKCLIFICDFFSATLFPVPLVIAGECLYISQCAPTWTHLICFTIRVCIMSHLLNDSDYMPVLSHISIHPSWSTIEIVSHSQRHNQSQLQKATNKFLSHRIFVCVFLASLFSGESE